MALKESLDLVFGLIGGDVKDANAKIGTLANLSTTEKTNLVDALNEIHTALGNIDLSSIIDDATPSTSKTYSSEKIISEINAKVQEAKDALLGGAGDAVDTLKELADLIAQNKDLIDAINAVAAKSVRVDVPQNTFTIEEKEQGRANIGAAAASDVESLTTRVEAVEGKADANETAIQTLNTNLGDIANADFVTVYNNAKAGTTA